MSSRKDFTNNIGIQLNWDTEYDCDTGIMKSENSIVNYNTVYTIDKVEAGYVVKKTIYLGGVDNLDLAKDICQEDYNKDFK